MKWSPEVPGRANPKVQCSRFGLGGHGASDAVRLSVFQIHCTTITSRWPLTVAIFVFCLVYFCLFTFLQLPKRKGGGISTEIGLPDKQAA